MTKTNAAPATMTEQKVDRYTRWAFLLPSEAQAEVEALAAKAAALDALVVAAERVEGLFNTEATFREALKAAKLAQWGGK